MADSLDQIKIAIIGTRGIPAKYGGYESFTESLSQALIERGYDVTVCCENTGSEKIESYRGVHLKYFPFSPPASYILRMLYEIVNDLYFTALLSRTQDILYVLGVGTAGWFIFFPKIINSKARIAINIDGLEWKRDKFSLIQRAILRINNDLAALFAHNIIVDSKAMEKYLNVGKQKSIFIPYGINVPNAVSWDKDKLLNLSCINNGNCNIKVNNYWLVVARLEPENNIHTIIEGYIKSNSKMPLCIVGDYTSKNYMALINKLKSECTDKTINFLGSIYDKTTLNMLRQNCFAYIHGHSVGGTNPSLLEAMSMKNIILAHDNEFNREVGGETFVYFNNSLDLSLKLMEIELHKNSYNTLKEASYQRVTENYSMEDTYRKYDTFFKKMLLKRNMSDPNDE